MFDVVCVGTDEIRGTYETGAEASRMVVCLNGAESESGSSLRFRVVKRKDESAAEPEWWAREWQRFRSDEYTTTPWLYDEWFSGASQYLAYTDFCRRLYAGKFCHFPHVAKGDPEKIAFTRDNDHGERDVQTRMRVGRYLQQFYGDVLSNEEIQKLCAEWDTKFSCAGRTVKFADTREDIARVYLDGPNSCMAHSTSEYNQNGVHPCEAYAAGDLAIAYLEHDERITARAICWPAKKLFGRVYGDEHRLHELMTQLGYAHENHKADEDGFCGARLLKLPYRRSYIMPWLDHVGRVSDNGKHFVIERDGEYDAQDTSGRLGEADNTMTCDLCGGHYNNENEGSYVDDRDLCDSCVENRTFYCRGCDEQRIGAGHYSDELDHTYCHECYNERHSGCSQCNAEHANENMELDVDSEFWCDDCAEEATRTEHGEIDPDYEPAETVREPTPTIHDHRQESLPL